MRLAERWWEGEGGKVFPDASGVAHEGPGSVARCTGRPRARPVRGVPSGKRRGDGRLLSWPSGFQIAVVRFEPLPPGTGEMKKALGVSRGFPFGRRLLVGHFPSPAAERSVRSTASCPGGAVETQKRHDQVGTDGVPCRILACAGTAGASSHDSPSAVSLASWSLPRVARRPSVPPHVLVSPKVTPCEREGEGDGEVRGTLVPTYAT